MPFVPTPIYTDFAIQFLADPFIGDIVMLEDGDAVAQGVRNIVLTNFYERFHHPVLATNTVAMLFENFDPITAFTLQKQIQTAIANYEPRALVLSVNVNQADDQNSINITVTFSIVNNTAPITVSVFLKRVR